MRRSYLKQVIREVTSLCVSFLLWTKNGNISCNKFRRSKTCGWRLINIWPSWWTTCYENLVCRFYCFIFDKDFFLVDELLLIVVVRSTFCRRHQKVINSIILIQYTLRHISFPRPSPSSAGRDLPTEYRWGRKLWFSNCFVCASSSNIHPIQSIRWVQSLF